jgi:hypothetical protein
MGVNSTEGALQRNGSFRPTAEVHQASSLPDSALSGTVFSFSGRWMLSHGNSFVTR